MDFGEVLTAMVTPFDDNLEVDYNQAAKLARRLVEHGSDGLVVLGTTGEVPTLKEAEKMKLVETVIAEVGDEASIVVGTGSNCTAKSIALSQKIAQLDIDGLMLVGPYYNKPPQYALYNHFSAIAESVELPIMVYNVPGRTSKNIEAETIAQLTEIDNIVAVKEASGDIAQITKLARLVGDDIKIYSGDDILTLPVLAVGGHGVISVASHVIGDDIKKMVQTYKQGQIKEAEKLNKRLNEIFNAVFITTNPIAIKKALNLSGLDVGGLRPPLYDMSDELTVQLKATLTKYELI